jgi:metal-sulfur cluster biosynthetic enzyme|tara:strand:+ start:13 stop:315 length:303 start_codon:yes stop_codon:yes gene_type:complete
MTVTKDEIINSLKDVYDPEVSVNIFDLGLIYNIDISKEGKVDILMTLTSPFCPAADEIVNDIVGASYSAGAADVEVNVTFQPEWGPANISDEGKLELGIF